MVDESKDKWLPRNRAAGVDLPFSIRKLEFNAESGEVDDQTT